LPKKNYHIFWYVPGVASLPNIALAYARAQGKIATQKRYLNTECGKRSAKYVS